jgi:hypothetical protein
MAHHLILGITESGKSTICRILCEEYHKRGIPTLVYDPFHDKRWVCKYKTHDIDKFTDAVTSPENRGGMLFVDDAGKVLSYNEEYWWLTTDARHYGHSTHLNAQRMIQVPMTMRDQCTRLILFNSSKKDSEQHAAEWGEDGLANAYQLNMLEFYYKARFQPLRKGKIVNYERIVWDGNNDNLSNAAGKPNGKPDGDKQSISKRRSVGVPVGTKR